MSWRKFLVRLNGLSITSTLVNMNDQKVIEDPEESERAVEKVWG